MEDLRGALEDGRGGAGLGRGPGHGELASSRGSRHEREDQQSQDLAPWKFINKNGAVCFGLQGLQNVYQAGVYNLLVLPRKGCIAVTLCEKTREPCAVDSGDKLVSYTVVLPLTPLSGVSQYVSRP